MNSKAHAPLHSHPLLAQTHYYLNRLKYEHEYEAKPSILELFLLLFHSSEIMSIDGIVYQIIGHTLKHVHIASCSKIPATAPE